MKAVPFYKYCRAGYGHKKYRNINAIQTYYSARYLNLAGFLKMDITSCKAT